MFHAYFHCNMPGVMYIIYVEVVPCRAIKRKVSFQCFYVLYYFEKLFQTWTDFDDFFLSFFFSRTDFYVFMTCVTILHILTTIFQIMSIIFTIAIIIFQILTTTFLIMMITVKIFRSFKIIFKVIMTVIFRIVINDFLVVDFKNVTRDAD